ncbi:MAG: dipeptidase [Trueperaceae bacterium]|nr:MAG: dipeptidase [Trueperaceae bacterium]
MDPWEGYLANHRARFLDELVEFLRIPSISSLPQHDADVDHAARWVADRMKRAGIEGVEVLPTGAHPVVYGEWLQAPGKPTVLIYGHYDVQPVDPLEQWNHPPFEPVVENGQISARGASDDKGNMLVPILTAEAFLQTEGALPLNLKFLFEGQEEIGSPQLADFIAAQKGRLACDLVVSADGFQWSEDQPSLLVGLRGLCALQIDVRGATHDLHSGAFGGTVQNPLRALVYLLDSMHNPDGKVAVAGFYDAVRPLTDEDRQAIAAVPFDEASYRKELGLTQLYGEQGYSPLERVWARPTLELNGIWGGFQGAGTKTVIPREAHAKITCRLVADQEPERIRELITAHIERHTPPGVTASVTLEASQAMPYLIPADHPGNQLARGVHLELYGKEPYWVRNGGSIPFCTIFLDTLGVYTVSFGFQLEDEKAHSPNEFFRLSSFERAQQAYGLLFERLSRTAL